MYIFSVSNLNDRTVLECMDFNESPNFEHSVSSVSVYKYKST